MRFVLFTIAAGLAVALSAAPAMAFGRGFAAGGVRAGGYGGGYREGGFGGYGGFREGGYGGYGAYGGYREGGYRGEVATGPYGGVHAGGYRDGSWTGPGGTTIQHGTAGGIDVGPYGGVRAGTVGGTAFRGDAGWAGGYRGGVAVGSTVGTIGGARVAAVGHTTTYYSPTFVRNTAVNVRAGYYPYFTPGWNRLHPLVWVPPVWVTGYNWWLPPVWSPLATFVGITTPPVVYDYGSTVVIQNDNVYENGDQVATAPEYATQAISLADAGRQAKPADTDEWMPLGVFGMIQPDDKVAQRIFQLAVNKAGVIRGNYYDAVADSTQPVTGSVDKKTQRAAWSIGDKKDIVFETGLDTLTKDQGTVLVHYGKDRTQQMILVRLPQPKDGK